MRRAARANNNFDLLRLIAAVFVLISHSFGILNKGLEQPLLPYGNSRIILSDVGLAIFFTISGFLVIQSLLNSDSYLHYLYKRALRIFPALIVVNLVCILGGALLSTLPAPQYFLRLETWTYLLKNSTLVVNQYTLRGVFNTLHNDSVNASLWTIYLEVQCYLLLILASFTNLINRKWSVITGFIVLQILRLFFQEHHPFQLPLIDLEPLLLYGSYFYFGMMFYILQGSFKFKWMYVNVLLAIALLTMETKIAEVTLTLFLAYLTLMIGNSKSILQLKGYDISYGLYLYAFPVQQVVLYFGGYDLNVWVHVVLSLILASVAGLLSWLFVEKPFLRRKNLYGSY